MCIDSFGCDIRAAAAVVAELGAVEDVGEGRAQWISIHPPLGRSWSRRRKCTYRPRSLRNRRITVNNAGVQRRIGR